MCIFACCRGGEHIYIYIGGVIWYPSKATRLYTRSFDHSSIGNGFLERMASEPAGEA